MDSDKTQKIDAAGGSPEEEAPAVSHEGADAGETIDLSDLVSAEKTQKLDIPNPSSTASFDAVSDKTQAIDIGAAALEREDGTREFPAVVSDDAQAKDMTVMLSGKYVEAMGAANEDSHADPDRDDTDAREVLDGSALVPTGATEVIPFTRQYFEQYETDEDIPAEALEPQTSEAQLADQGPAYSAPVDPERRRRRIRVLVIIICLVVAAIAGGIAGFLMFQNAERAKAMEPHAVALQIDAPEYGVNDSKIPVHVEGASFDGSVVDEVQYVDINGHGVELIRGDYALTIAAAPLMEGARIYRVPDTRVRVEIDSSLESGAEYKSSAARFSFEFAYLIDVTDEDIENSYTYALKSGFDETKANEYKDALMAKRDSELAAHKAEEERQRRLADTQSALENYAKSKGAYGINSKLVDLDGDGFPELLLAGNAGSPIGAMCFVVAYDAQSHRTVELASAAGGSNHSPSIWYSKDDHEVVFNTQGNQRESYTFYTVKGTTASVEHTYVHEVVKVTPPTPASPSPSESSSSASQSASSAAVEPSVATPVSQDVCTRDGQTISIDEYNGMINSLNNYYASISAP